MNVALNSLLKEFTSFWQKRYPETFFLEQTTDNQGDLKLIVMTEAIARDLRQRLENCKESIVVSSLEKDTCVGSYYKVNPQTIAKVYNHPGKEELDRILHNLPDEGMLTREISRNKTVVMINELMGGEVVRGIPTKSKKGWIAVAACHDYESTAPQAIGWMKLDGTIEMLKEKKLTRPAQLLPYEKVVGKYLNNIPYHWGGKSLSTGFDCSSFVQSVTWETKGVWLPKLAKWQAMVTNQKTLPEAKVGDLIFFNEPGNSVIQHVGMIHSKGKNGELTMIHASPVKGKIILEEFQKAPWHSKMLEVTSVGSL